jgi:hypothetical protein
MRTHDNAALVIGIAAPVPQLLGHLKSMRWNLSIGQGEQGFELLWPYLGMDFVFLVVSFAVAWMTFHVLRAAPTRLGLLFIVSAVVFYLESRFTSEFLNSMLLNDPSLIYSSNFGLVAKPVTVAFKAIAAVLLSAIFSRLPRAHDAT